MPFSTGRNMPPRKPEASDPQRHSLAAGAPCFVGSPGHAGGEAPDENLTPSGNLRRRRSFSSLAGPPAQRGRPCGPAAS